MAEIKTIGEFVKLVKSMRSAQKRYFNTSRFDTHEKDKALVESKALEKDIDSAIREYEKRLEQKTQPNLF